MDRAPSGWVRCQCGFESSPFKSSARRPSVEGYIPASRIDRKNAKVKGINRWYGEKGGCLGGCCLEQAGSACITGIIKIASAKSKIYGDRELRTKENGARAGARHVNWESCQLAAHTRLGRSVGREDRPPQWGAVHEHTPVSIPVFMNTKIANSNFH